METTMQVQEASARIATDHAAYVGSIPDYYHQCVGPVMFEGYARELAQRVTMDSPQRVLEIACGTGILTRRLREALTDGSQLVASDLNEPMLSVARATVGESAKVEWMRADMTRLHLMDASFDTVVCQFGIMFVADKPLALREFRRVLKPGGRVLLATWRALEHNPALRLAHEIVSRLFPQDRPQFYRVQTGSGESQPMARRLREAGFVDVRADPLAMTVAITNSRELAMGLIRGFPIVDFITARDPSRLPVAIDALTVALDELLGKERALPIEALISSALAPSPS